MGSKSASKKKPRTAEGLVFSRISPESVKAADAFSKLFGRDCFDENVAEQPWVKRMMQTSMSLHGDRYLGFADVTCMMMVGRKRWRSIYINSRAVADFLERSEPRESDAELIAQSALDAHRASESCGTVVHLPFRKHSIMVCSAKMANATMVCYSRGDDVGYTPIYSSGWGEGWGENCNKLDWRIIFNLFLYMSAFPECVTEGPPQLSVGSASGEEQSCVSSSPAIEQVYQISKSIPHMRRGHFRTLRSERYKNKRFQAIYVKPAMVNGDADSVIEPTLA